MAKKRAREADGASADPDKMVVESESSDDEASHFSHILASLAPMTPPY